MNNNSVEAYALSVLAEHGCDCYTYGGEYGKYILEDLKEAYPEGMEYPYVEVANAILAISRVKPIIRAPYRMVWDTDSDCDGIDCDSFGAAKAYAEDTLLEWMCQARSEWMDVYRPSAEELDDYNYMICNCSVSIYKYNPDTDEYEYEWSPDYMEEKQLGWKELTMKDIAKQKEENVW